MAFYVGHIAISDHKRNPHHNSQYWPLSQMSNEPLSICCICLISLIRPLKYLFTIIHEGPQPNGLAG